MVTGGAGFIGSHIVDRYLRQGHDVLVVDDLSTGRAENVNSKAIFQKLDISDFAKLEKVFADFKPEVVNHHAAQIDVRKSVADPVYDARVNITGSLNLLELGRRRGIKRFIFASSGGCVYGESKNLPIKEEERLNPMSPYGLAKVTVENYLRVYHDLFGMEYVVLRYSNVYGPRQDAKGEAGVVAIFVGCILQKQSCTIYGDGNQTRDYVCVGDVVDANDKSLTAPDGIYNIGTSRTTSVNGLVDALSQVTGTKIKTVYEKPRRGELMHNCLDITRARKILGWEPKIDLVQGIGLTYDHFRGKGI